MTVINTNSAAMLTANSLLRTERSMAESMQRLSTGRRINTASDDAAGLAIATKMTAQVRGLQQAARNVNNAMSMVLLADGAAAQIIDLYQRMRELAVQAADGSNSTQDAEVLNREFKQAAIEADRIADSTQFNGKYLLNGSAGGAEYNDYVRFQVGANANQTLAVDFSNFRLDSVGFALSDGAVRIDPIRTYFGQPNAGLGASVSSSADGGIVAIGAPTFANDRGRVVIRDDEPGDHPLITAIPAISASSGDIQGQSIALSADGQRLIVGSPGNSIAGLEAGSTTVYERSGSGWTAIGSPIVGDNASDYSGFDVSISDDGNTIAIGTPTLMFNRNGKGIVKLFNYSGGTWNETADITSDSDESRLGKYVALSGDGNVLAVSAIQDDSNGDAAGHVKLYQKVNGAWMPLGSEIVGDADGDRFGSSIALSNDGHTLAVSALENDAGGNNAGQVRVYRYESGAWTAVGHDILGANDDDQLGRSVALSGDGQILAVSSTDYDDGADADVGQVSIYKNINDTWVLSGSQTGSAVGDEFGGSLALSDDGSRLIVGATGNPDGSVTISEVVGDLSYFKTSGMGTSDGINTTIERLDQLIAQAASQRATFGAALNRLSYAADNLASSEQATSAARGRIEDTNYATETTALARSQIISQAGTAMLAQANQKAASVLSLLR
jgi:flagellin-like hook-associated protein FlgL